jgi:hypothetical protein
MRTWTWTLNVDAKVGGSLGVDEVCADCAVCRLYWGDVRRQ